ncbi:uncharacterized protein LOC132637555 [Lycium barbarum]|uniref:uncharacterized protein LOC132637555 n=1 Tax=Lycium barbarum TaxID=112863 RepID=UPI00293EF430|nr:uncharacterized protein LOC132637555 [Lycium barbarum]
MKTRRSNRLKIQQQDDEAVRHYIEKLMDDQNHSAAQPYIEQFMDNRNNSEAQSHDGQSNELNSSSGGTEVQHNDDSGNSEARKVHGRTLLKDIWKLPAGKTVNVPFNSRNQVVGKEGRNLASFLGIVARTPELTPLHIDDWRIFGNEEKKKLVNFVRKKFSIPKRAEDFVLKSLGKKWKDYKCTLKGEYMAKYKTKDSLLKNRLSRIPKDQWSGLVSYWFSDKVKRRTQANRNNRTKQKMSHTGGSKSIATLMDEKVNRWKLQTIIF